MQKSCSIYLFIYLFVWQIILTHLLCKICNPGIASFLCVWWEIKTKVLSFNFFTNHCWTFSVSLVSDPVCVGVHVQQHFFSKQECISELNLPIIPTNCLASHPRAGLWTWREFLLYETCAPPGAHLM